MWRQKISKLPRFEAEDLATKPTKLTKPEDWRREFLTGKIGLSMWLTENGDITQTAAVQTTEVCLHMYMYILCQSI